MHHSLTRFHLRPGALRIAMLLALALMAPLAPLHAQGEPAAGSAPAQQTQAEDISRPQDAAAADAGDADSRPPALSGRLSGWLLLHPAAADDYLLGMSWRAKAEIPRQQAMRKHLLKQLQALQLGTHVDWRTLQRLGEFVAGLPVTGRVEVANADVRWLQANPNRDPLLTPGDEVVLPQRPATVTVLGPGPDICQVVHQPSRHLMDYVDACAPGQQSAADWVWVAQPDGRVQRFGVAAWNLTPQEEPAPGAWIWAPERGQQWPDKVSADLVRFLATQGPAADMPGVRAVEPLHDGVPMLNYGQPHAMPVTANDWGEAGLLQTPTARMRDAGELAVTLDRVSPYTHMNVFMQPFDWLEGGFRYTDIGYQLAPGIAVAQTYKDKSIDLKLRLLDESAYLPELAVGWRDILGTGLFSGEYLVASKRTGDLDWSLGLGWGYLGHRGNIKNPFGLVSPKFNVRPNAAGQTGNFSPKSYFRGPTSLFGGVQYHTPWAPLLLKLEYDGNNYRQEPFGQVLRQRSPFNVGAVYRLADSIDLSAGYERGNTFMFGITLHSPLSRVYMPKLSDPPRVPVADARPAGQPDWSRTGAEFTRQTSWPVKSIDRQGHDLHVTVDDADAGYWKDRLDRGVAVLHRDAPADIENFTVDYRNHGMGLAEHQVNRSAWVDDRTKALPPGERLDPLMIRGPGKESGSPSLYAGDRPRLSNDVGLGLATSFGGPDNFILYQLYAKDRASLRLNDSTWLQGEVHLGLLDNYNKFKYTAPSNLPRVRTNVRQFVTGSKLAISNLQLTHTGKLSENNFYSLYGGYLEDMYAGVGGEWLYRPLGSPLAFGIDVNAVRERGFKRHFSVQKYQAVTGHASLYWDTGWNNIQVNLSAGRYLAKDVGATIEVLRYFENGVVMGAGMTKTNVSAAKFGEGSFDKWIRISIPFDALLTRSSSSDANFVWQPLLRDGGARLNRDVRLYDLTRVRDPRTMQYKPADPPNDTRIPEDRKEAWTPPATGVGPYLGPEHHEPVSQWQDGGKPYRWQMQAALYRQHFRAIDISMGSGMDGGSRLELRLANDDIRPVSRAVGRALRTALLAMPEGTRAIRITFLDHTSLLSSDLEPVVQYDFNDLDLARGFVDGGISESALARSVQVSYLSGTSPQVDPFDLFLDETPVKEKSLVIEQSPSPLDRVRDDLVNGARYSLQQDWLASAALGGGIIAASSLLDKSVKRYMTAPSRRNKMKTVNRLGNTLLPAAAVAGATVAAFSDDPLVSKAGYASLEAGGTSLALSYGLKYAVGRARPFTGQGFNSFHPFAGSAAAGTDSFPSGHTMLVWSMITPFAEAYDAPWLYGVAALTNLARVGSNKHWFSDTVAGSVLGYAVGKVLWESSLVSSGYYPTFSTNGRDVVLSWNGTLP